MNAARPARTVSDDRVALMGALAVAAERLVAAQDEALQAWAAKLAEELKLNPKDAEDAAQLAARVSILTDPTKLRRCLTLDGKRVTPWVCLVLDLRAEHVDERDIPRGRPVLVEREDGTVQVVNVKEEVPRG